MSDPIRIGIIGVGQIGKDHLRTYKDVPGAQIVAAADVNAAELKKVAETYAIPQTYPNFRDMLARNDIDAVDVCVHNNLHMPLTVAALESGKHVYCEKPMAGAYADAARMLETAVACGRKLSIQLSTLFAKETRVARELIAQGRLGHVYHARSTGFRRRGRPYVDGYGTESFVRKHISAGGALYDMGVYHIAQALHLLGNPVVERIAGKTYQETDMHAGRREHSGYNVEELGLGFVRLADRRTLDIIEAWAVHMDTFESPTIFGSAGGIRLQPFGFFHTVGDLQADTNISLDSYIYRWKSVHGCGNEYDTAQHHWVAALQGRVELLPTAETALNTMLISEGIYLSDRLGREVSADEVREQSVSTAVKV